MSCEDIRPSLEAAAEELLGEDLGFMQLPKTTQYAESSQALADEIRDSGATDFIHAGIGGSALGPMAVQKALNHPYYNQLTDRGGPRIHFAENTDPASLSAVFDVARPAEHVGTRRDQKRFDRRDDGEFPRRPGLSGRRFG